MQFKLRITLLVLILLSVLVYAGFAIQSDPKRAPGGEFVWYVILAVVVVFVALLSLLFRE
jgi:hypothetical protein